MLRQGLERGLPVQNLMENWDFLQVEGVPGVTWSYNGKGLGRGLPVQNLMENWDFLQVEGDIGGYLGYRAKGLGCPPLQARPLPLRAAPVPPFPPAPLLPLD